MSNKIDWFNVPVGTRFRYSADGIKELKAAQQNVDAVFVKLERKENDGCINLREEGVDPKAKASVFANRFFEPLEAGAFVEAVVKPKNLALSKNGAVISNSTVVVLDQNVQTVRAMLFAELADLRAGNSTPQRALAVACLANTILKIEMHEFKMAID